MSSLNNHQLSFFDKHIKLILVIILVCFISWEVYDHLQTRNWVETHHQYERGSSAFNLLNPKVVKSQLTDVTKELESDLFELIQEYKSEGKINDMGVYIRDLNSGYGFGVDENIEFIPASLLKMFPMVTYYKSAEQDDEILQKKILYKKSNLINLQTVKPNELMQQGEYYTIENLIERSIVFSDNDATSLLIENIDSQAYKKVFEELGVEFATSPDQKAITPKIYSNLFRVLYNASYLDEEYSQKALTLLNSVKYDKGIKAGLNGKVELSNKFGERVIIENGVEVSYLHDCGIIYARNPYVLCVMTRGTNFLDLENAIADISNLIFRKMKY